MLFDIKLLNTKTIYKIYKDSTKYLYAFDYYYFIFLDSERQWTTYWFYNDDIFFLSLALE